MADPARGRRPGSALGLAHPAALHPPAWEHARPALRSATVRLRRGAGGRSGAEHRRHGHAARGTARRQHSTTDGAEIEAAGSNANASPRRSTTSPTPSRSLIKGRSGGASTKHLYRSGPPAPATTSYGCRPAPRPTCATRQGGGTVTITSSVAIMNDTTWSNARVTWRPRRLGCTWTALAGHQHRGEHEHQRCVRHLPLGLGLLDHRRTSTATSRSSRASPRPGPRP